jgi:peptidoglycan/xylan/chitin deacetylase (PgdA/CDA1 family)
MSAEPVPLIDRPLERILTLEGSNVIDDAAEARAEELLGERWRDTAPRRALSAGQLDVFYRVKRFIPRGAQLVARRVLVRRQLSTPFPRWPFDASLVELVRQQIAPAGEARFEWFWPEGRRFAFILTHDVESGDGLRLAVELADIEQERGFRSSFNIVADGYPIDWGVVRELQDRGFEIGVHGIHHDRSLFESRESFERQLPLLRNAAQRFGAVGFRSPATHRVIDWLPELPVEYDCTVPHSDPFEPQPGGCCSPWPYFIGDLVELPYTLPQDHTLFTLLRQRGVDLWLDQVEQLARVGGLAQSVSHPDTGYLGDAPRRALFVKFLDVMRSRGDAWHALPREIGDWWRDRDAGTAPTVAGVVRAGGSTGEIEFAPLP